MDSMSRNNSLEIDAEMEYFFANPIADIAGQSGIAEFAAFHYPLHAKSN
jgi:hypothetical protein